jgi:hypothetical protein
VQRAGAAVRVTEFCCTMRIRKANETLLIEATGADRRAKIAIRRASFPESAVRSLGFLTTTKYWQRLSRSMGSVREHAGTRERSDPAGRRWACFAASGTRFAFLIRPGARAPRPLVRSRKKARARCCLFDVRTKLGYSAAVHRHRNIRARRDNSRSQWSGSNRPDIRYRSGRHK